MENWKEQAQKKHLEFLAKNKGGFSFIDTFFPYTSGEIGPYYVQSGAVMRTGTHYNEACRDMSRLVEEHAGEESKVISGGESRDWMFSFPVSQQLQKPHLMIYKNGKLVGMDDLSEGYTVHVADLNNEGSSVRDLWVPKINELEGKIEDVFFYVDRMEDGVKVVENLGLKSYALVSLDANAWEHLQKIGVVAPEVYSNLMERMEDKDEWARNMLRSKRGLKRFAELYTDPITTEKAKKILNKGYPDIREEVVEEIKLKIGMSLDI